MVVLCVGGVMQRVSLFHFALLFLVLTFFLCFRIFRLSVNSITVLLSSPSLATVFDEECE